MKSKPDESSIAESISVTCLLLIILLTFINANDLQGQFRYTTDKSTGLTPCFIDSPNLTVNAKSKQDCMFQCVRYFKDLCIHFNFRVKDKKCEIYDHTPYCPTYTKSRDCLHLEAAFLAKPRGPNVALRKNATQSSTYSVRWYNPVAGAAVDGNDNPSRDSGMSCSVTDYYSYPPWWSVDLVDITKVTHVKITNRDSFSDRLINFNVGLTNVSVSGTGSTNYSLCAYWPNTCQVPSAAKVTMYCRYDTQPGRFLFIQYAVDLGRHFLLTLCEVEVYAEE